MKMNKLFLLGLMIFASVANSSYASADLPECETDPEIVGKLSFSSSESDMSCDSMVKRNNKSLKNSTPSIGKSPIQYVRPNVTTYSVVTTTLSKYAVSICTINEKTYTYSNLSYETSQEPKFIIDLGNGESRIRNGDSEITLKYVVSNLSECRL